MKLRANRKNLRIHARALLGNEWTPEVEKALITECLTGFVRQPGHISHSESAHIARIDRILGNCGAQSMLLDGKGNDVSGACCPSMVKHDLHYSNTGDSYGLTVLYHNHKLFIGDWWSIFERLS